ncbi:MAG: sulfite exporter TauE/SafE family protein [Pseudonocardiaceae bacterium]
MERLLIFALVGLAAQAVDGSLGMAYGVTSSTLLVATGVAPAVASASVHLAEVGTTLASGVSHWRLGNVDWKVVAKIAIPGGIGAFAGATVLSGLSSEGATPWVAGILLLLGVYIILRFVFGKPPVFIPGRRPDLGLLAPLGLFGGFIDATGGGGWGPVTTPTLIAGGTLHPRKVIGSVSTAEFVTTVSASIGFLLGLGGAALDWRVIAGLLVGGVIAAPFAAYLVKHLSLPILGGLVGSIILITNGRTLLRSFGAESVAAYGVLFAVAVVIIAIAVRKAGGKVADTPEQESEPAKA